MISSAKHFLARAFPVPKSLELSNVSVSISDGRLFYFEMKSSGSKRLPKAWGSSAFPKIRPSKSDETQKDAARAALAAFTKDKGYSYVRGIVHEGDAYVFRVDLPTTAESEFRSAIESLLEENVPVPLAEALFEYSIVKKDHVRGQTTVAVSVVPVKTVEEYTNTFLSGGLLPVSFETEARALAAALYDRSSSDVSMLLAIMPHHSVISIIENSSVVWSSSIELGSEDIGNFIARGENGVFDAALPVFSSIHDEMGKVLAFWKTSEKKIKDWRDISRIVLVGRDSLLPGFARYISLSFGLPVEIGSVWTNLLSTEEDVPALTRRDSLDFGHNIGALL